MSVERELNDIERARELYRKARDQGVGAANQALTRLETPELTIETERAFRPGDTPRLHIVTRNIEAIDCEAYAIDLETYFRAKHTLAGVADLDIALIDPDQTWRHEVADYEEFRLFETDAASGDDIAWPVRADGTALRGDEAMLGELERLAVLPPAELDVDELTQLLYSLREFDRTRPIAAPLAA